MRAVICPALGDESGLVVGECPRPAMIADGVRIKVHAAGVNFADSLMLAGTYQEKLAPPFVPGMELAGEVVETAPGVTRFSVGQRVMAVVDGGAFAEEAVARADDTFPISGTLSFADAASLPIAWGTAFNGLAAKARLAAGETLLVTGAGGGVGLAAVAIGKVLGARVVAAAGDRAKLDAAKAHGADALIDTGDGDFRQRIKDATNGRGADVVFDAVGGDLFDQALRATRPDGRILVIGFAAGRVPQIPANIILVKNITVIGYYWGAYRRLDPASLAEGYARIMTLLEQGRLRPQRGLTLDLGQAGRAIALLKARAVTGKVVLTTGVAG